jgi:hypothetical protein
VSRVLNTSLYLPFGKRETTSAAAAAALVQDLLCYDKVCFFTDQMAAVTMLAALMTPDVLQEALERGVFHFYHDRQMLAWPVRAGYSGPSPIMPIATMPNEVGDGGASHASPSLLVASGLGGFGLSDARRWEIGRLAEAHTSDYQWPPKEANQNAPPIREQVLAEIRALKPLVVEIPELPLRLADLNTLEKKLLHKTKSLLHTNKFGIVHNSVETGWAVLKTKDAIPPKQLGMVHLAIAERFLKVLELAPGAVLHTEPLVESILRVRAAAIRKAAAGEVSVLLEAEEVALPTLTAVGDIPYRELLESRDTVAAQQFRKMVHRRDLDGSKTLLNEYLAALHKPVAARLDVRIARYVIGTVLGSLPGVGGVIGALDAFLLERLLAGREAAFYVDHTLRRIANKESAGEIQFEVKP